jgi:predicted permease
MKSLRRFFSRLSNFATRRDQDARLREEIDEHIALQTGENIRSGMSPIEARRQAMLKFGGMESLRQDYRAERGLPLLEDFFQDLRLSARLLRKSPSFTAVAVVTLALAIGANAVVFAVLNAFIIRPINVPHAESLYGIERGPDKAVNHSFLDYRDLRERNRTFEDLAAYNVTGVGIDTGHNPSTAWICETTANYFDTLEIQPYLGRFFHASDEHGPNSAPYIVLTYAYWHAHFQDDRTIAGRVVQLNKHPFTILGVAPPEFRGTISFVFPDFWVPIVNQEQIEGIYDLDSRGDHALLMVMGHLKPGVTAAQAVADLDSIGSFLEKSYPKEDAQMNFTLMRPGLAGDWFGGPVRQFLSALMFLAGLILLAACANLGSLFAARASDRSREVALRLALGSSRSRILRQVFTEAILVSLLGGAVGLWGSTALMRALTVWRPIPSVPLNIPVTPDANVYLVALLLSLLSGFLFGLVPVRQILHTDPYLVIKSGSTSKFVRRIAARDFLLVGQITICALLVTASLVAVRGLIRSVHTDYGFEPRNAIVLDSSLAMAGYTKDTAPAMQKRIVESLSAISGVQAVGLVDRLQLYYGANSTHVFSDQTSDLRPSNAAAEVMHYNISPGYFSAAGTTLLAGRTFTSRDDYEAPRVAVVNREFAGRLFSSPVAALGSYFKGSDGTRYEIVGIVENAKYASITESWQPALFLSVLQSQIVNTTTIVRSNRDPRQLTADLRSAMQDLDAGLPVEISTWNQELEGALIAPRMATLALGVMGGMGALLSITGIFGMAAYSVSKRKRELGIRMALGAQSREVLQAALGHAVKLLALGSVAGLILGILASRVLASIVYQATPRDPLVLAGVVFAMTLLGLFATWIPAQRALAINPNTLLREE